MTIPRFFLATLTALIGICQAATANSIAVSVSASSTQDNRYPWMALDGDPNTRWCAENSSKPQWLQLDFEKTVHLDEVSIAWESKDNIYGYTIESSLDGSSWTPLIDARSNNKAGSTKTSVPKSSLRFLRINGTKSSNGWISIWELTVKGEGIQSLEPKLNSKDQRILAALKQQVPDPYAKSGNVPPKIIHLSEEEEAEMLKDVKVPEGFEATLFAPSATANYPVYVAASPSGDLYVSSDGNGSLGRNPERGRVLRLRDTNNDGRADQVTEFIKQIDSPRGLIWDQDRLYLLHPPHISVFFDQDGDGIAERSQRLIEGIAFDFDMRPPDHTTNGLELGIDGWIYIAGGDFGFMEAVGTDGRRLQHRGGGVIRFRPDGTGMEIFATGTRNILGTPTSPLLDIFARDNTNDGGGWDVRFHHFTGLEDHGYPRLYKNFSNEHIQPLADYGGGSGCGSVYIHEPGFPEEWANAPFTCDWGRAALFHHSVKREDATFIETEKPKPFIKVTRPTDADVDAMSRVYQASWKGPATFNWAGPDHGYITRVTPKGYQAPPLPDFASLTSAELIDLLESPSHIRTLTAQRTLLRRNPSETTTQSLVALAENPNKALRARVAALYAISQAGIRSEESERVIDTILPLAEDPALQPFVLRALGDMGIDRLTSGQGGPAPAAAFVRGLNSSNHRTRLEAMVAAARQKSIASASTIIGNLGHADPVLAHTAFRSLAELNAIDACFTVIDSEVSSEAQRRGAGHALMRMQGPGLVDNLIIRLRNNAPGSSREAIQAALCRLHNKEAKWTGDSWGTRPDTRGPFYQLEPSDESKKILAALQSALANATPSEAVKLVKEMNRNRIHSDEALNRIIDLANSDNTHVTTAVAQLAAAETIPARAIPLLLSAAKSTETPAPLLAETIACLGKIAHKESLTASLTALVTLDNSEGNGKSQAAGRSAFLKNPRLDNHHEPLKRIASTNPETEEARWAHAGLLELASRKNVGPEAKASATEAINLAWQDPIRKILLINLAADLRNHHLDARISAARSDFDPDVVKAAERAARRLRIPNPDEDSTAKIESLSLDEALTQVVASKGDVALGEAVFNRAACATCHTVSQDQQQKGPYLGNIATTYRRNDLAESILRPNKTIAQGFATHLITLKDDATLMGFITNEAGDEVTLRDIAAQEHTLRKDQISNRTTLPTSIMPPGLMSAFSVHEMASLLDYLESLAQQE